MSLNLIGPGSLIEGRYALRDALGQGGQGSVFSAWDQELERPLAIKLLGLAEPETVHAQFAAIASARHPNLVTMHDLGFWQGQAYITMDLVQGPAASQIAWAGASRPRLLELMAQCLVALEFLHSRSLVHRDVKPGNLLLSGTGLGLGGPSDQVPGAVRRCADLRVRLADFGLVHRAGTPSRNVAGTIEYLPPEVFDEAPAPTWDLYALGITIFELLTGELPAGGGGSKRFLRQPTPLPVLPEGPEWLSQFLGRMAAPFPEQRFASARYALAELERHLPRIHQSWRPLDCSLVGRQESLVRLEGKLQEVRKSGVGQVMFLSGPEGIGKTRLARELAVRSQIQGWKVVSRTQSRTEPLACFQLGFDPLAVRGEASVEEQLQGAVGWFDRGCRELAAGPTLILIDDFESREPVVARLIDKLPALLADVPLLLVLCCQQAMLTAQPSLELFPLEGADFREMVAGMTAAAMPRPRFIEQLWRSSRGIPGRAGRLLMALTRQQVLERAAGIWSFELEDLPDRVWQDLALDSEEVPALPEDAEVNDVFRDALILGPVFETADFIAVRGDASVAGLEKLSLESLLEARETRWRFVSESVWRRALEQIPEAQRRALHDRAASRLRPGSAAHLQQRAAGSDPGLAAEALTEMARRWRQVGASQEAIDRLQQAGRLSLDPVAASAIRIALADTWIDLGDVQRAIGLLEDSGRSPQARLLLAKALARQGQTEKAGQLLEELEAECRDTVTLESNRLGLLGEVEMARGRRPQAKSAYNQALILAASCNDEVTETRLLINLGNLLVAESNLTEADDVFLRAQRNSERRGDQRRVVVCLNARGVVQFLQGNLEKVVELLEGALRLEDRVGLLDAQLTVRLNLGLALYQLGHLDRSRLLCHQALALADRLDASPLEVVRCLNNQALVELRLGSFEAARNLLKRGLELCQTHGLTVQEAIVCGNLGDLHLVQGELDEAQRCFQASFSQAALVKNPELQMENLRRLGEASLIRGDLEEARKYLEAALPEALRLNLQLEDAQIRHLTGKLLIASGQLEAGRAQTRLAVEALRSLQAPFELAGALSTLAFHSADPAEPVEFKTFQEALSLYRRMGLRSLADQLQRRKNLALASRKGGPSTRTKLETLLQMTASLSRSLDLDTLLVDIVEHALVFTGAQRAILLMEEADSGRMVPRLAQARGIGPQDPASVRFSNSIIEQVRRTREPLALADLSVSDWAINKSIEALGLQSVLCVPMQVDERLLGLLYIDAKHRHESKMNPEDLSYLQALANHAALAVHKAQTHQDLMHSYQHLEQSRDQLELTLQQLHQAQEGLIRAEKHAVLGELATSIAHELSQPLSGVFSNAELAMLELERDSVPRDSSTWLCLERIFQGAEHMAEVLRGIRRFSGPFKERLEVFPLSAALELALKLVHHQLLQAHIDIEAHPAQLPMVQGDRHQMMQIFVNLLMNARDALEASGHKKIRISGAVDAATREGLVWFEDNGPGIEPALREKVFERFFTTKRPDQGSGLGLAIIRQILLSHGGSIRILDREERGVCFELRFPPI